MTTKLLSCTMENFEYAAGLIRAGEVVAFPTETVYGLGANAFDAEAVRKIFEAKGRPADNPLIVHICDTEMLKDIVLEVPPLAKELAKRFWPGALTMIMPKSDKIPNVTSGGLDTVGVRFPSHPAARLFIECCKVPIAAPSANLSGSPSPTNYRRVLEDMNGRIPAIIAGGDSQIGLESTVICFENGGVRILRPGGITREMLSEVCRVSVDDGVLNRLSNGEVARSPGMKYRHYAPKAQVMLINGEYEEYRKYVLNNAEDGDWCLLFSENEAVDGIPYICYGNTPNEQAKLLFEDLRLLDEKGAKRVFARCPFAAGIGLAVYNRILRASGFSVVDLEKKHENP